MLLVVRQLKSEVPDDSMLDLFTLMQNEQGVYEVPKYDPLWEIIKRLELILPLVKVAQEYKPDPYFEVLIGAGETFVALDPVVVFDSPEECFSDDKDTTELPLLLDKRVDDE